MKREITAVYFGGSIAIYVDGKLSKYDSGQFRHEGIMSFLLENIHENFEKLQTITISDYSTYWDNAGEYGSYGWLPEYHLSNLIENLDLEHDILEGGSSKNEKQNS